MSAAVDVQDLGHLSIRVANGEILILASFLHLQLGNTSKKEKCHIYDLGTSGTDKVWKRQDKCFILSHLFTN